MINPLYRLVDALSPLLLAGSYYFGPYGRKSDKNDETSEQSEEDAAAAKNRAEMKRERRRLKRLEIQKRKEQKL